MNGILKKRKRLSLRQRQMLTGILFIAPWLVGAGLFFLRNVIQTVIYSFHRLDLLEGGSYALTPVGFENYRFALFENVNFNPALVDSIFGMLIDVPMIIFFSLFIATLLNRKFAFRTGIRAIFFLPVIMATAAINNSLDQVMVMIMGGVSSVPPEMAEAQVGLSPAAIMGLLLDFGMPPQIASYILDTIAHIYNVIRASSVQIVIFLAALQSIPGSLYEVAQIEGATGYESFWKITFPMVSPLILTNVVYTIIDTYSRSNVVEIARAAAFSGRPDYGLSAAMSIISATAACLFLFIVGYSVSKYAYYQN